MWSRHSWAIRPYYWGTGSYLPWEAAEGVGRGKPGFCSFGGRPGWAGILAKSTRGWMTSQSQERYQDLLPIQFLLAHPERSFLGRLSFSHYYLKLMEEYYHRGTKLIVSIHL